VLFNSLEFLLIFLPATLFAYYPVRRWLGHEAALALLTLASLVFYGWWNVWYIPLLLGSVTVNHVLGKVIMTRGSKPWLTIGVIFNLGLIGVFKYADFFISNVNAVTPLDLPAANLILPLAISFFTFQQISFLVDAARGDTKPGSFLHHALFVTFFPQLIAGPIVRHEQIADQYNDSKRKDNLSENLGIGLSIFAIGLAKKVLLADSIEPFAASGFELAARGEELGLIASWVSALAYSLQIFFDFSGYSDMAIGLARMFGYHLPPNFNAPYRATSVVDFWHRWHITLSNFLRDYLYIPLGGNRLGEHRRWINLFIVMLLGGLWHGAAWTYVAWGGLHGLGLAWGHWLNKVRPNGIFGGQRWIAVVLTFAFVTIAWVFFRASSFDAAWGMLAGMSGMNGLGAGVDDDPIYWIILGMLIIRFLPDTISIFSNVLDKHSLIGMSGMLQKGWRWEPKVRTAVIVATILFIAIINSWTIAEFIYYQF
jgi:alginate O-acetyltransferase complex protein AlgI